MRQCNTMIIFAESRRLVDDTRAIIICHICIHEDAESFILELKSRSQFRVEYDEWSVRFHLISEELKQRGISPSLHIRAFELANFFVFGFFGILVERPK